MKQTANRLNLFARCERKAGRDHQVIGALREQHGRQIKDVADTATNGWARRFIGGLLLMREPAFPPLFRSGLKR